MARKFTDNAATTLASAITAISTTLAVAAAKGDNFPAVTGRGVAGSAIDYSVITLEDAAGNREKIKVEHRAAGSDTLGSAGYPLVRGYDGTVARAWNPGDIVDLRVDRSELVDMDDKITAAGPGRAFGLKGSTTVGLTFGYYGGQVAVDGVVTAIADGTVLLTASQTNYVERTAAGVVSANVAGFSADKIPLYQIVTDVSGIQSIADKRSDGVYRGRSVVNVAGGANVVLTRDQLDAPVIELQGLITANIDIVFPAIKRAWIVYNNTTGAFVATLKVVGQTGVVVPQTKRSLVYCDATDVRPALTDFAQKQTHTAWVPSGAMIPNTTNPPAGPNQTETAGQKINFKTLDFADGATTLRATVPVKAPKGWDGGPVKANFVWMKSTGAGDVVWQIRALAVSDGDAIDTAPSAAVSVTQTAGADGVLKTTADTANLTPSNAPASRDLLFFEVFRDPTHGSDTFNNTAKLIGVEFLFNYAVADDA